MAVAGKVAITLATENNGAWSADVTYDRLVAVKHNNNLYISRKTVANVEPPNDEFWFLALEGFGGDDVQALIDRLNELIDLIQAIIDGTTQVGNAKTLDGHGVEYFFPKSGGTINGDVTVEKTSNGANVSKYLKNLVREIREYIGGSGVYRLHDVTNGKDIITSNLDGTNVFNGTASGNLPLTANGNSTISRNTGTPLTLNYSGTANDITLLQFNANGTELGRIGFDGVGVPIIRLTDGNYYNLLHTGNKPTGTYTGNGSATERTIVVNGLSKAFIIRPSGSAHFSVVTSSGYIAKFSDSVMVGIDAYVPTNGNIALRTSHGLFNEAGVTYEYISL